MATQSLTTRTLAPHSARFNHEVISIDSIAGFRTLRAAWNALARSAEDASLCDGYDYCELAASLAFKQRKIVNVLFVRDANELVVLWPFVIERRGLLRIARRLTCGAREEYGQPLIRRDADDGLWLALLAALGRIGADVLEVQWVVDGSPLQIALDTVPQPRAPRLLPKRKRGLPGYVVGLRGFRTFDEFEKRAMPPALRRGLGRYRRRLEKYGRVESGWCETAEETIQMIRWLVEQKRSWLKARGATTEFLTDDRLITFFSELAQRLDLTKTPLTAFLKVDGVPVAGLLGMVGTWTLEGMITAYDPAFSDCSVGSLQLYDVLCWAHARGLDFDFRPVHVDYKARWATRHTWHETRLIVLSASGWLIEFAHLGEYGLRGLQKLGRRVFQLLRVKASAGP